MSAAERDRLLVAAGVQVERRPDGAFALPQRCAALSGCRCTVYADRPGRCREYQCLLFAAVEASEVDLDEARAVIHGAGHLIAELGRCAFGAQDDGMAVVARFRALATDAQGPALPAEARRAFLALQAYLDRHFRGRR